MHICMRVCVCAPQIKEAKSDGVQNKQTNSNSSLEISLYLSQYFTDQLINSIADI